QSDFPTGGFNPLFGTSRTVPQAGFGGIFGDGFSSSRAEKRDGVEPVLLKNIEFGRGHLILGPRMTKTFAELNFPGRLVAVEGLDGSGKSTQIYLLKRWLELQGLRVFFSEWNSSDLVKNATSKGKKRELLTPTTFSLIHATDFADRYERQLVPLLRAGYIVLCDRYIFTAFARDTVRGCPPKCVP